MNCAPEETLLLWAPGRQSPCVVDVARSRLLLLAMLAGATPAPLLGRYPASLSQSSLVFVTGAQSAGFLGENGNIRWVLVCEIRKIEVYYIDFSRPSPESKSGGGIH